MPSYVTLTEDIEEAARFIAEGRVVAVPTGTSYGLAADALQGWALQRVRILKDRPEDKSFTVFMDPALRDTYLDLTDAERELLERFDNQPLTLLVTPKAELAHLAKDGRIGLRVMDHPVMTAVAKLTQVPLTATSANRSGGEACNTSSCIEGMFPGIVPDDRLAEEIPRGVRGTTYNLSLAAIIDGGDLPSTQPTTIARLDGDSVTIIRQGQLAAADIAPAV
tara:strand:+ start:876 stop:1541 length:666 start_codon:yes stop_codon:yes gene_type:complete